MSWQSYVDTSIIGKGLVAGAIIGFDGSTWATSPEFSLQDGEGEALAALFNNPDDAWGQGIVLNGINYRAVKADAASIYGTDGAGGVITSKTGQAIIIGVYNENVTAGDATKAVEMLGDYLRDQGY